MIIDTTHTHQTQGLTKVTDFKIASNAIMVRALTERLYSDPVRSIVRELASNALDACPHKPMEITLPNYFNSKFSIRDYGPGLSPSQMVSIFTIFGESTKRDTNSQIGGFGLGAKSPFAHASSFTIDSWHQGTHSLYTASIGEDGMPGLHLVTSQPTTETGLRVTIPTSLVSAWKQALDQLEFFEPRPLVDGVPLPTRKLILAQDNISLYEVAPREKFEPRILVGPVAYPLNLIRIGEYGTPFPVTIRFPIGGIEVTASREEVVYSPEVMRTLKEAYSLGRTLYQASVEQLLDAATTVPAMWDIMERSPFQYSKNHAGYTVLRDKVRIPSANFAIINKLTTSPRIRWNTETTIKREDRIFVLDDTVRWYARIKESLPNFQGRIAVFNSNPSTDDIASLDQMGLPYTLVSSLPNSKPAKGPSRGPRLYAWDCFRERVVATTTTYPYYIKYEKKRGILVSPDRAVEMTTALYKDLVQELGSDFNFVPSGYKGKLTGTDACLIFREKAAKWQAQHGFAFETALGYNHALLRSQFQDIATFLPPHILPPQPVAVRYPHHLRFWDTHEENHDPKWGPIFAKIAADYPALALLGNLVRQLPTLSEHGRTHLVSLINHLTK